MTTWLVILGAAQVITLLLVWRAVNSCCFWTRQAADALRVQNSSNHFRGGIPSPLSQQTKERKVS
jgi:hypothetical protein